MELIETHAHLYVEEFKKDLHDVIRNATENGISHFLMPNLDSDSIDPMLEIAEVYPDSCIPMMGLHPCYVKKDVEKQLYLVEDWLNKRKFCAVGEIGLDFYWDTTFKTHQEEAFKIQIELSIKHNLPIVIHSREATQEVIDILKSINNDKLKGVFHCYSGTLDQAQTLIEMGFYLGIGGVLTFKKAGLDLLVKELGAKKLVLETDSPYLAPVPHRGKRNEPLYLQLVAQKMSEILEIGKSEIAQITSENAKKLFSL